MNRMSYWHRACCVVFGVLFCSGAAKTLADEPVLSDLAQVLARETEPNPVYQLVMHQDGGASEAGQWNECSTDVCYDVCCERGPKRYRISGRVGTEYFSVPEDTSFGGLYGVDLVYHLRGDWGFYGSANANHVTGGTQVVGTVGLFKLPRPRWCDRWSRVRASVLFDQFTDSRVDDDLYLSQLRFRLGYAFPNFELGATYTEPVSGDTATIFLAPGNVRQAQSAGGYLVANVLLLDLIHVRVAPEVGWREMPDTLYLAGKVQVPLADRLSMYGGLLYEEELSLWSGSLGFEFGF